MARMVSLAGFVAICATRPCFCFLLEITMYSYVYNLSKICACLLLKKYCQRNQLPQCTDAKKQWQQIETNWVTTQNAGKVVEFETRWNVQNRERFVREIELTISRTSYFQNLKHFFSFNERCLEWNGVYWSYCFSDIVCIFVFQWF